MAPSFAAAAHDGAKRLRHISEFDVYPASRMVNDNTCWESVIDEVLPQDMLMEIISRLPDARDVVRCAMVNNLFRSSSSHVKAVRFLCKLKNMRRGQLVMPFKDTVICTLERLKCVESLRLEIEDEMQACSRYKDDDIDRHSLWLSERSFIMKWMPWVSNTLQNLTIIDYGQQAIFHATALLQILATHCNQLRTLELRNMFLDCREVKKMKRVTTLTLRCVKLTDTGLKDLNECMPALETLTLVTVVGLKEAEFTSRSLKVLCLGLATKVKSVKLRVRHLVKLQLKMACPDKLTVDAPDLQCLAVCMDKRDKTTVEFENVKLLRELLMGASEFTTLTNLSSSNPLLEKVFLDVPCMGFEDSGRWKGVLRSVPLAIPDVEAIRSCCPNLQTLSVGPGLWHALEESSMNATTVPPKWPTLRRLILHLIVQNMETTLGLLTALVKAIPMLVILEIYVHTDSTAEAQEFYRLQPQFPHLELKCDSWRKGLRFDCFSF